VHGAPGQALGCTGAHGAQVRAMHRCADAMNAKVFKKKSMDSDYT
jgi:hypothetical protein